MSIPQELLKPIDEIKSPSNKILIICLLFSVIFLVGLVVINNNENKAEIKRLSIKNDYLQDVINAQAAVALKKEMDDNARLRNRDRINDSLNATLNNTIQELKRKIK